MKKRAPKNATKSNAYQYCLDGIHVNEVLPMVKDVSIIGCRIRFGMPIKRRKMVVPVKLRKCGVQSMSAIQEGLDAEIVLDATTPTAIRKSVKTVAEHMNVDPSTATFRYLTVGNKEASARFVATTKEMQPKNEEEAVDLRKKAKVLGLKEGTGKVNSLIRDLGAEKFQCDIKTVVEKQIVLCRKVK